MKKRALLAVGLFAVVASGASADVVLNLGNANLAGGQTVSQTPQLTGTLLGIVISFDYAPDATAQLNGSWASDAALAIQSPITVPVQWGGYDTLVAGPNSIFVDDWIFIGESQPGPYTDIRFDVPIGLFGTGGWTVTFGNGWADSTPVQYNSITVTLMGVQPVPAASSAAVLGLAGLGLGRRRRR